jgi:predicted Rossmann fold nucleotide-binding protein DprA/Smf involved in DNA uptake
MTRKTMARMGEAHIARVLYHLRADAIREGAPGLEHVNALLILRGHDPEANGIPAKRPKTFPRGELRRRVLDALRGGPKTTAEIADGIVTDRAVKRVRECLVRMEKAGMVRQDEKNWILSG